VAGVTQVLLGPGLASNDINMPGMNGQRAGDAMTNDAVILGIKQIIERAHAAGIKVIGTTLLPFEGVLRPGYATPEHMEKRDAINQWIRSGDGFDGFVDFDAVVRDPAQPERLLPRYDGGNHFEPSEAGEGAMAAAVNVNLFRVNQRGHRE
jgi:lysophospholipase L1-like esterase